MIKTLFLSGARVDEFVHIRVEDLHLDGDPPQIHLRHCKKGSNRYIPILPTLFGLRSDGTMIRNGPSSAGNGLPSTS